MSSHLQSKQVTLIVLNYNDHKVTTDFCMTLSTYACINHIIIVDNHSTDDSLSQLQRLENDKIHVIETGENGGYAKGNNAGLLYCEKHLKTDLVIISNPDVQIDEGTLMKAFDFIDHASENCGLVSPKMTMLKGKMIAAWKLPTYWTYCVRALIPLRPIVDRYFQYDPSMLCKDVIPVDVLPGSFFISRFEAFKQVGYFDDRTFLFGEENILAYKFKQQGYQNYLLGNLTYIHAHSLSINKNIKSISKKFEIALESDLVYLKSYLKVGPLRLFFLKLIYQFGLCLFLSLKRCQALFGKS